MKPHSSRLNDKLFTFENGCYDFFMLQTTQRCFAQQKGVLQKIFL